MRLRKDLSFTKPAQEVMLDFNTAILPLFGDEYRALLMEQALYQLPEEMVQKTNDELREMDQVDESAVSAEGLRAVGRKVRHAHRRHVYLPSYHVEQYGILMQNLQGPGIDWLVEFKPKWLVQSPSAPSDARNCRTCALNALRRKDGKHKGRGDSGFCPFDLLVGPEEGDVLTRALKNIWPLDEGIGKFVAEFTIKVQPALRHLQRLEQEHGSVGLDDFQKPAGKDFGVAMALRDCSVFLALRRSTTEGVDVVDVKFADLDLKTTEGGKVQKWAAMEQELLDGGWYYKSEGSDCSLSRAKR
ncbi:inositol-pentakisphosphate 2-kinase [Cladophialophora carrionii]|uniref:Inositol-pentakisphosphate 2-kinase n=1 Tax=Cladophialophora carrionii TaxID=86049 RepID=A0A1C1CIK3_9EURO|nr:inositol-pentakisphosphate 2-kinase [Cladophialophora carrionii]